MAICFPYNYQMVRVNQTKCFFQKFTLSMSPSLAVKDGVDGLSNVIFYNYGL